MATLDIVEVKRITNSEQLSNVIYRNFKSLIEDPSLLHTPEEINSTIQSEQAINYLVYYKYQKINKLIAYLIGETKQLSDSRYVYYISYLYVLKKFRNMKIGTILLQTVIDKCKDKGIKFIVLRYDTSDTKLKKFYDKFGFTKDPVLSTGDKHDVVSLFL